MSVSDFLKELLEEEKITQTEENIRKIRKEIKNFLVEHYKRNGKDVDYIYGGSLAKGMAIKSKYDIDIGIIFDNKDFDTLEEMFFDVKKVLEEEYSNVNVREQNVSIRVNHNGYEIDVVPCRKINEDGSMDVYLYINSRTFTKIKIEKDSDEFNKTKSKYTEKEFINLFLNIFQKDLYTFLYFLILYQDYLLMLLYSADTWN